ncbi:MAG: hypothetical protein Q7J25_08070 [Vicinamibacterales bacterium]|nr:hypothetical protein [Vicinamibacterales bacterium]
MRAYSMDLRERVLRDSDAGMMADTVAEKYHVSGSWVRLLKQRRRDTGDVAPRQQRYGPRRKLASHVHTLQALIDEQPGRTLAELQDALGISVSLATIWRAVKALGITVDKNGPPQQTRARGRRSDSHRLASAGADVGSGAPRLSR